MVGVWLLSQAFPVGSGVSPHRPSPPEAWHQKPSALGFLSQLSKFLALIVMSLREHFVVSHAPSLINHRSKCCFSHVLYDLVAQNRSAAQHNRGAD